MKDKNEIKLYKFTLTKDIYYITPDTNEIENQRVINAILNAWKKGSAVDWIGRVLVQKTCLNTILRTTKENAKYYASMLDKDEIVVIDGKEFIKGYEILKLLDIRLQQAKTAKQEKNLRFSQEVYRCIRDSDKARLLRAEYREGIKQVLRNLKKQRINKYNIKNDELTNELLKARTCEFSHIRSYSIYPQYADDVDNGLIVNKEIHKIITSEGIQDEEELFELCKIKDWNIKWYEKYKQKYK